MLYVCISSRPVNHLFSFSVPLPAISMRSLVAKLSCGGSPYVATSHISTPKDLYNEYANLCVYTCNCACEWASKKDQVGTLPCSHEALAYQHNISTLGITVIRKLLSNLDGLNVRSSKFIYSSV